MSIDIVLSRDHCFYKDWLESFRPIMIVTSDNILMMIDLRERARDNSCCAKSGTSDFKRAMTFGKSESIFDFAKLTEATFIWFPRRKFTQTTPCYIQRGFFKKALVVRSLNRKGR